MSTYSTNLALTLIGTGEEAGTWGTTTNTNLGTLLEQAISGYVTQAVSTGTDTTITIPNGSTGVARNMYIELTGTGGANTNLIVPANKKLYYIYNNTSSGQVTVKVSGQTGISVPNGKRYSLVSNGTDIVPAINDIVGFTTVATGLATTNFTVSQSGTDLTFVSTLTCTASIASTTMTVTAATVGQLIYGQALSGSGVTGGTTLAAQLTSTETAAATPAYSSGGAAGESSIVLSSVSNVAVGQMISGTGVPAGTYVGGVSSTEVSVSLVDRTGAVVTLTTQASGTYTFAAPGGKGTYTVSTSQTVSSTTITMTKTIASLSVTGQFTANSDIVSTGTR
jgi:hypothetical protein